MSQKHEQYTSGATVPTVPRHVATIYIASSSRNIAKARTLGARLESRGCLIEKKWWEDFDKARERGWSTDAEVSDDFARRCAWQDLAAVARCDAIVFLDSPDKSFGAALEIGYALASGKPLFVLGKRQNRIWERLDEWVSIADEDALFIALVAAAATRHARDSAERRALSRKPGE